ncbi:MAG: cytochrome c oxidase assembly protein [Clostridia bacterium]
MTLPWYGWLTPGVLTGVAMVGFIYAWAMWGPMRDRRAPDEVPTRKQAISFYVSLLAVYAALGSPIGVYAMSISFTMHMFQHMIAGLAVPPFFIRGIPSWAWRRFFRSPALRAVWGRLVRPVPAILMFNVVFGLMVFPPIITSMVDSMSAMLGWHLLLMATGIFMWWPIVSPSEDFPPLHPGVQILYLFLDGMPMILPLAIVTLDTTPLYAAAYGHRELLWGLTLAHDQQLGGALCLTVVHFVYGSMVYPRFLSWVRRDRALDAAVDLTVVRFPRRPVPVVLADGSTASAPSAATVVPWPGTSSSDS